MGKRPRWAGTILAAITLASCGGGDREGLPNDYTDTERVGFIKGCTKSGSSKTACACVFEFIRSRLTYDEFDQAGRAGRDDWSQKAAMVFHQAGRECGH